jgi:hypothetical protein
MRKELVVGALLFTLAAVFGSLFGEIAKDSWAFAKEYWKAPTQVAVLPPLPPPREIRPSPVSGPKDVSSTARSYDPFPDFGWTAGDCCEPPKRRLSSPQFTGGNWSGGGFGDSGLCCEIVKPKKSRRATAPGNVIATAGIRYDGGAGDLPVKPADFSYPTQRN